VPRAQRAASTSRAHVPPLTPGHTASLQAPALPALQCTSVSASCLRACLDAPDSVLIMHGLPARARAAPPCSPCLAAFAAALLLRAKVGGTIGFDTVFLVLDFSVIFEKKAFRAARRTRASPASPPWCWTSSTSARSTATSRSRSARRAGRGRGPTSGAPRPCSRQTCRWPESATRAGSGRRQWPGLGRAGTMCGRVCVSRTLSDPGYLVWARTPCSGRRGYPVHESAGSWLARPLPLLWGMQHASVAWSGPYARGPPGGASRFGGGPAPLRHCTAQGRCRAALPGARALARTCRAPRRSGRAARRQGAGDVRDARRRPGRARGRAAAPRSSRRAAAGQRGARVPRAHGLSGRARCGRACS